MHVYVCEREREREREREKEREREMGRQRGGKGGEGAQVCIGVSLSIPALRIPQIVIVQRKGTML